MLDRLGTICFSRRRWVAAAWGVLFVLGIGIGSGVIDRFENDNVAHSHESIRAQRTLADASPYGPDISAIIAGIDATNAKVQSTITNRVADIGDLTTVSRAVNPYQTPQQSAVADDENAVLVTVNLTPGLSRQDTYAAFTEVAAALRSIGDELDGATVTLGGETATQYAIDEQTDKDTKLGEAIALPITLIVMVLLFGGFIAAAIPIIAALVAIAGGLLILYAATFAMPLDSVALSAASILGLGLAIDYSLLIVSRFREERAADSADVQAAVRNTVKTAGRTVIFSGLTVAASLCGLFLLESPLFHALGLAGLAVVLLSIVVALTLTPALLGFFANRIKPKAASMSDSGAFANLARWSRRFAPFVVIGIVAILAVAALPFLRAEYATGRASLLPRDSESYRYRELAAEHFTDSPAGPVLCVMKTSPAQARKWLQTVASWPGVHDEISVDKHGSYLVAAVYTDDPDAAEDLVTRLRDERASFQVLITGEAAITVDLRDEVRRRIGWVLATIAVATFVLLFLMTGSVLIPLKALIMNTLSLSVSFGALVWIFQEGHLSGLLGFTPSGKLETYIPVLVLAFAFGLAMDYEVFLLARIKELRDHGYPTGKAVQIGLQRTGKIITAAGALMIIVFLGFVAGQTLHVKQLGAALAIAVLVDATLIRCVLVPATMTLMGRANWWAPGFLRRLHDKFGITEGGQLAGVPTAIGIARAPWVSHRVATAATISVDAAEQRTWMLTPLMQPAASMPSSSQVTQVVSARAVVPRRAPLTRPTSAPGLAAPPRSAPPRSVPPVPAASSAPPVSAPGPISASASVPRPALPTGRASVTGSARVPVPTPASTPPPNPGTTSTVRQQKEPEQVEGQAKVTSPTPLAYIPSWRPPRDS